MNTEIISLFIGVDWATTEHQVCVVDQQGTVTEERVIPQSGTGLREFVVWLSRLCEEDKNRLVVGIEVPHGALVETLLDHGFAVHSINPKQLDRFRDRHFPAGAKDDRRDAYVLATSLRTDGHCFGWSAPIIPLLSDCGIFHGMMMSYGRVCIAMAVSFVSSYSATIRSCWSCLPPLTNAGFGHCWN